MHISNTVYTVSADRYWPNFSCFGCLEVISASVRQAENDRIATSLLICYSQCEEVGGQRWACSHPSPRSLHSQKSVSGRMLPTAMKCSIISHNSILSCSDMIILCFQHVFVQKRCWWIGTLPWAITARGSFAPFFLSKTCWKEQINMYECFSFVFCAMPEHLRVVGKRRPETLLWLWKLRGAGWPRVHLCAPETLPLLYTVAFEVPVCADSLLVSLGLAELEAFQGVSPKENLVSYCSLRR